jgi:hypothetical protein
MHEEQTIEELFESAKSDPSLLSSIDIDALLEKTEDVCYLENKTLKKISEDIFFAIDELKLPIEQSESYCSRLSGYRLVDRLCYLRNGQLLRWIKKDKRVLTNGGLLVNVKMDKNGTQLLCKNNANRFFNVRFDECVLFHKLTTEEQLILMAQEYND